MKRYVFAFALLFAFSGCGGGTPPVIPGAKNGGNMIPLADKKGYVEIHFDVAAGGKGKVEAKSIVVWFLGSDGSTPLAPSPTDVSLKMGSGEPLKLTLRESDGAFVSLPGDFPQGIRGTLAAKVGGDSIETIVAIR